MSPHFGIVLPLIDRVIGRTGIRIHPGNTAADSQGCVLVGEYDELLSRLMNSKRTFVQLMARLMEAQQQHEEIWIHIIDATPEKLAQDYIYDCATEGTPPDEKHLLTLKTFTNHGKIHSNGCP